MKKSGVILLFFVCLIESLVFAQINSDRMFPENIGGKAEFKRGFEEQLVYPQNSLKKKIGGKVTFNFAVLKDGSAANIKMIGCGTADIDAEAMRLFKLYQWTPAIKSGECVDANWSVTFSFDPDRYSKICYERGFVNYSFNKKWNINNTGNQKYYEKWKVDSTGKIYLTPEQFPIYPEGNYAMEDYIKENLEYPRQAQLSNIQGTVILRFVVEPNGLITNIGVENSIGGGCDQEALRLLQMIKWFPGIVGDKLVRTQMKFPFHFILNDEFKDNSAGEQK